ncbi:MAG: tetratricopeptide repeat protein [Aggregatilineales bacterium]
MQSTWHILDDLIQKQYFKKAEATLKRFLTAELSSDDRVRGLIYRVRVRLLTGRPDDALDTLREIATKSDVINTLQIHSLLLEFEADALLTRYEMAQVGFADRSDLMDAQSLYRQIISKFPHYENLGWIYYQLGRVCLLSGQIDHAEKHFHHALLHPSNIQALTALCYERLGFIAFFESRQTHKAITFLQKAIDTYPAQASPLWLIEVHLLQSRVLRDSFTDSALEQAQKAYDIAQKFDNKTLLTDALFAMAEITHHHRHNPAKVIDYLQLFIQTKKAPAGINVTWSRVYEMLADAHFALQDYEQAIQAYEHVFHFNPDYPWEEHIQYQIACSHYQAGAYRRVIEIIQPLLPEDIESPDKLTDYHNFYNVLGNAYFATQQYTSALEAYDIALSTAPAGKDTRQLEASYHQSLELK